MTLIEFPSPHRAGLGLPPPIRLMSGLLADAAMLVREGRASADAVDLAMRLGAGYPQGPLATLAALPPEQSAAFAPPAREQPLPQAEEAAAPAWDGPIGLVGTGTMAGGIAEAIARSGRRVVVLFRSEASSAAMRARIAASLARSIEKGRFTPADGDGYLEAIATTGDGRRLADCQLVIEAVKEDLETKRRTIAALDAVLPRAIPFATNTSSFRVSDMASAAPGRALFAMHFFNPAQAMKLVELVYPAEAPAELRGAATAFVRAIGKVPVDCADTRGFVVNRLLIPFLNDAVRAHEAGLPAEAIDRLMTETMGHPMGPFALIDMIGLDVMVLALEAMAESEGDPRIVPAGTFRRHIAAGRLGRKSGHGFHAYGGAP